MFSKELEQSIANLFDQAQDKNLEYLTIEHLLLMLISDYEVRQALETNDVNLATLRENLEEHVRDNTPAKVDLKKPVQPTLGFQRVLQRAVFHVQSSGKGVVKPINLLVAIFSEKECHSVFLLSPKLAPSTHPRHVLNNSRLILWTGPHNGRPTRAYARNARADAGY